MNDWGEREAAERIGGVCFKTGPPRRLGVELEWLVRDPAAPQRPVPVGRLDTALAGVRTAEGARITREPGGQVELSGAPAESIADCLGSTAADLDALRDALAAEGLAAAGLGLDPLRLPPRVLHEPRYRAMEDYFDRRGPWGRMMMRATASVQVNLDSGEDAAGPSGYRYRWLLAHRLGPVLVAAFANSPLWQGRPTGWKSTRQAVWTRLDPARTRPAAAGGDPREAWARYALDAPLMCRRRPSPADWEVPDGLTFRGWLRHPDGRPPEPDDLDYHLSTLFPPVRPRGWLELRMIDAQDGPDGWTVPAAVAAALLDDPDAAEAAWAATEPLSGPCGAPPRPVWLRAARRGPADPAVGRAVRECLAAAVASLAADPAADGIRAAVAAFADRYADRGRCPADDVLDTVHEKGLAP